MIPAEEALVRLIEGNKRFIQGRSTAIDAALPTRRESLVGGQQPFAIVLGCSDSRVPVELVFDQALGDLFVVRVAGNVLGPSQLQSIEFSAEYHGARLVVILGHSHCAAVAASVAERGKPAAQRSTAMQSIVGQIAPVIEQLDGATDASTADEIMSMAVRANVQASVRTLRQDSRVLCSLADSDALQVVGAEYSLETGAVDFFDNSISA